MSDPASLLLIGLVFLLAGVVKGVIGLGLPTVSLGLLTATLGLPTAMALLLLPSFVTNVWQALIGGHAMVVLGRIWPFLLMATATVWIGALALSRLDGALLSALLGALLAIYAAIGLAGIRLRIEAGREGWAGPLLGAVNGVLTGMTGSFVVPGVMFLQAIGLPRDQLVQAMGMLFTLSTVALAVALQGQDMLPRQLALVSAAAVVPALIGMVVGQRIRGRMPETAFRRAFLIGIGILGIIIIARALA